MKVSLSWLSQYVPVSMDMQSLADALTMVGLEVDSVRNRYEDLRNVLVGRIDLVHPHPNADKLRVCEVMLQDRTVSVVCGAPNAAAGRFAPVALPGARLADGSMVQASTIRGVLSEAMLCSEAELGLGTDTSGLMLLDKSSVPGRFLNEALALNDPVMEIDLTPNRPDCLSILGIAREVAAICKKKMSRPDISLPPGTDRIEDLTSVTIQDPDHCPRYTAALVFDLGVGPSPFWLQDRLLSVGLRPINNIVDITNFVMMETGQPLHAFDFDRLAQNRIVVRTAREGEKFTSLDGKERLLSSHMLMICDGEKPVGIGGVMGGQNSEIDETTTRVLLESAYFAPTSIRRTSKKLGLLTDASHRFERGVDPGGTVTALKRAAALMVELGKGRMVDGIIDAHPKPVPKIQIPLSVSGTNRVLGTRLSGVQISKILESIEFSVAPAGRGKFVVTPPSFRVDVSRPEDLMEEVARLSGYDRIPVTYPLVPSQSPADTGNLDFRSRLRSLMTGFGFSETVNYSFAGSRSGDQLRLRSGDPRRETVAILNPLTEDQSVMRTCLAPGLLETTRRNMAHQIRALKIFEIGKVFLGKGRDVLPMEIEMLSALWTGSRFETSWHAREVECDFYDIKGTVEGLLEGLRIERVAFSRIPDAQCDYLRPGSSAHITAGDKVLGSVGEVHPEVLKNFDLGQKVFLFELQVESLKAALPASVAAAPIPRFPSVTRDITLIVGKTIEVQSVRDRILSSKEPLVESLTLFDVFEGNPIPGGKRSLSFRIMYRSHEQTLEDDQVNRVHQRITEDLLGAFDATLPG